MSDTATITDRLEIALERISTASQGLVAPAQNVPAEPEEQGSAADSAEIQAALDAERAANAQLEERVKAIGDRQESVVGGLESEVAELRAALASRDARIHSVREANGKLRRTNRALRQANAQSVGDSDLINEAMVAELEALRAVQAADRVELDEVLNSLEPVVGEAAHA